jgi:hypothetical protein
MLTTLNVSAKKNAFFKVDTSTITATLTQPFEVEMEFFHENGYQVILDSTSIYEAGTFAIDLKPVAIENISATHVKEKVNLTITPYVLGEKEIPELKWNVIDALGNITEENSPAIPIKVEPLIKEDLNEGKIFEIYNIIKPINWLKTILWILIIAAVLYGIYRWLKPEEELKIKKRKNARPLDERINDEIEKLVHSGIWEEHLHKKFYVELTDIAREYIDERYTIDTHKLTTYELLKLLRKEDLDKAIVVSFKKFMGSCDLVKFAKYTPETDERDKDIDKIKKIILQTTPASSIVKTEVVEKEQTDLSEALLQTKKEEIQNQGGEILMMFWIIDGDTNLYESSCLIAVIFF